MASWPLKLVPDCHADSSQIISSLGGYFILQAKNTMKSCIVCHCKVDVVVCITWKLTNPGRRWVDPPLPDHYKLVISGLLSRIRVNEQRRNMGKQYVIVFVVDALLFVVLFLS
uniref:Uncharacterized protein n=1 Tax=Nicotiana tabacum TaxID=4097 RepID=A0A1S3ZG62_TOBAC|nr:PREDICTED: uncharacterized protein LOC107786322 [Nicotiana tabacum]